MRIVTAAVVLTLVASVAHGQNTSYGDPDIVFEEDYRFGFPEKLTLSETGDVSHDFNGSLAVPYTMDKPAMMWLAVYSEGADTPACDACGPGGALVRSAGLDTLVFVSQGVTQAAGSGEFIWDGTDYNGNAVPQGTYRYFLFAVNTTAPPTMIGGTNNPFSMGIRIDATDNASDPWVYWMFFHDDDGVYGNWVLKRKRLSVDISPSNDAAPSDPDRIITWESFPLAWIHEMVGMDQPDWAWTDLGDFQLEPSDPNTFYFNMHRSNSTAVGVFKAFLDEESGTFTPDPDWPEAAPGSFVELPNRLPGTALLNEWHHAEFADDGLIWITNWPFDVWPSQPRVLSLDRATGAIVDLIDYTADYTTPWVDVDGADQVMISGPFGLDVDAEGIYTTGYVGHWFNQVSGGLLVEGEEPALESFPMKRAFDGSLIWQNRNGDGFVDRYVGAEAVAAGVDWTENMWSVDVAVASWGITAHGAFNTPTDGTIIGPDGNGLFTVDFRGAGVGGGIPGYIRWVNQGTDYDGLIVGVGGELGVMSNPADMITGLIGEGMTAVAETGSGVTPASSSLGDAYPNPFNPDTAIPFEIADVGEDLHVRIAVYNLAGQEVAVLADELLRSATYEATWDGIDASGHPVGSGVYIVEMKAGDFVDSKRMTLLK